MLESWSHQHIALLESLVAELLTRPLTPADLPLMRWTLAQQQTWVEAAYRVIGHLTEEVEALRRLLDEEDDEDAWD